jgi:ATP-dependent RNA helicase DHX57
MGKKQGKETPPPAQAHGQGGQETVKQRLFGNWTGKTPLSLLHEYCQRQGWNKPSLFSVCFAVSEVACTQSSS